MKILPANNVSGSCKKGQLNDVTATEISKVLGFKPNTIGDEDKVKYQWTFTVDGIGCEIWDYKGSYKYNYYSFYGPEAIGKALFGDKFEPMYY